MTIVSSSTAAFSITKLNNNNNKSLYFDLVTDMQLIRDDWTMVTYYDMNPYWEGFKAVEKCVEYLQKACVLFQDQTRCKLISTQLQHDYTELKYYNELLLNQGFEARDGLHSRQRRHRGLINGVGYIANSLFGLLDQHFVEKYTRDIQLLKENNKHIHALYKNQTSVIEAEYNLLKRTEEIIAVQHKTINKHLNILDTSTNNITRQVNALSIMEEFTLSSISAINLLTKLRRIQDNLLSTLVDIYHGRFNIYLLSPEQFRKELQIISSQLAKDLTLPLDDIATGFQEMYRVIRVKSRVTNNYFIFEIKFPLISRDYFQLYKLIPIPYNNNNRMIKILTRSMFTAINLQKDAYIDIDQFELQNCLQHKTAYLCKLYSPIKHMSAEERFCRIDDMGKCKIQMSTCKDEWFELSDPSTYLYFHCQLSTMRIICDKEITSLQLENAGLIRLDNKCIAKGKDFTFFSNRPQNNSVNISPNIIYQFDIAPINNFLNLTLPNYYYNDIINETIQTNDLEVLKEKIEELKKGSVESEFELSSHDIHQYAVSYSGVAVAVVILVVIACWWWRWRGQRAGRAPRTEQAQLSDSESVDVVSARKQSTADRQPSVSVLSDRYQSMVDIATSPIITKRVFIDVENDTQM
ncbi:unnamed protein product [Diatraea saccharalis]|uniref:Envelope fusion protein n=1 Tax=Diatraea saccharalis TaxID=40085 RepID=A0A9N9WIP7_9NEOP|nr:unnamed protein product [Diatraea saccharalis]